MCFMRTASPRSGCFLKKSCLRRMRRVQISLRVSRLARRRFSAARRN
nr:MAG TPA: hypothetical protein [Caudoviricetes sp.]